MQFPPNPTNVLISVFVVLAVGQFLRLKRRKVLEVEYLAALEGAKLLREWCTWLATIATGSLGAIAFLSNNKGETGLCRATPQFGDLASVAFSLAILFTATLLLALPSVVARLNTTAPTKENDLYECPAFHFGEGFFSPLLRIGFLASAQYLFFVTGIASFAYCAVKL